ncbi:probable WRKY transcription factor 48 isoform X2 [Solanum tuberosum]|nr:PREDICTED: probable WRKY transcription factor 48 isoform X2 [Solanum tuberosum]
MEKENNVKTNTTSIGNGNSSSNTMFDIEKDYSLSFLLETMFGVDEHQDCYNTTTSSIFDLLMFPSQQQRFITCSSLPESSSILSDHLISNVVPVIPNLSSISSSSTELPAHEDHQHKYKKQLKPNKKKQKGKKEPRFAFMTKSEVDHLDDGFRWRKYGQKAVKNSPFPRSYYRCTTSSCGVKKRVERSIQDTSIVVTTYEGVHTHPCPLTPRGWVGVQPVTTTYGGRVGGGDSGGRSHYGDYSSSLFSTNNSLQEKRFWNSSNSSLAKDDHGLLQDMVSSRMRSDLIEE